MENASKALIIAGGILLAMMILSLLIYVSTSMSSVAEEQDKRILTKQIEDFNKGYLAYNKTKMYGTDVITVVNKAIDHNRTIEAKETDPYYINIIVELNDSFKTTGKKIKKGSLENEEDMTPGDFRKLDVGIVTINGLKPGRNELGVWKKSELVMYNNIIDFFAQDKEDIIKEDNKYTYRIYSALTNFKTTIFKCTDVSYENGRVKSMTFTQI